MISTSTYPSIVQPKTHVEVDYQHLEHFQRNVVQDLQNLSTTLSTMQASIAKLERANKMLATTLDWVHHHYPEVMKALSDTVNVTIALDKSNEDNDHGGVECAQA